MLKKATVFGLAFGCAFAIITILAASAIKWYASRPKSWDAKAITCASATAASKCHYTAGVRDAPIVGFSLTFALANNTNRDYTLSQTARLFRIDSKSRALADFTGRLGPPVFIPAGESAELTLDTDYSCAYIDAAGHDIHSDESTCFKDAFGDAAGFVALDDENKIRINLSKPVLQLGKKTNGSDACLESTPFPLLPPNKGDIFDQLVACDEADRLVSLCRRQNFRLPNDSFIPDSLRDLPQPPKGYKLDASADTCEIATEWQNYCRAHK